MCIESVQEVSDEILVIDSFSTDQTKALAESLGAKVLQHPFEGYSEQKNYGNSNASHDYILSMDADECLSDDLRKAILQVKENPRHKVYDMKRKNYFCNTWIKYAGWYPDKKIRLWHKDYAAWDGKPVHESVAVKEGVDVQTLKGDILHYSFDTVNDHFQTIKKYSQIRIDSHWKKKKYQNLSFSIFRFCYKFLKLYFLKLGFLDGKAGLIVCFNSSIRHVIEYGLCQAKLYNQEGHEEVCFFNSTKTWGGGEKWHFNSANYLAETGRTIHFVTSKGSELDKIISQSKIKAQHLSVSNLSFLNLSKIAGLIKYFRLNHIQAVIFNGPADLKLGGLAAFLAGVPKIVYRRGLAKAPKGNLFNSFLYSVVVNHFIVNSKSTLKELCRKTLLDPNKLKVKLLYNSVKEYSLGGKPESNSPLVLGNASRLVEQKGIHYLLEVGKELDSRGVDYKIKIAGTGPLQEELVQLAKDYKIQDKVEFLGFVEDVEGFMKSLDIYLCTSIFEGFGFSIAEAMEAQKPVVGFDTSSNPELIQDGKTGFVVGAFDIKAFTDKTVELLENETLRSEFGKQGHSFVRENFDLLKQHQKLEEFIYNELLEKSE